MISKKHKELLQSIGYSVVFEDGAFYGYLPGEEDPCAYGESEEECWAHFNKTSKVMTTHLIAVFSGAGRFVGVLPIKHRVYAKYHLPFFAEIVASRLDEVFNPVGSYFCLMSEENVFEPKKLWSELYQPDGAWARIDRYDLEGCSTSVMDASFDPRDAKAAH